MKIEITIKCCKTQLSCMKEKENTSIIRRNLSRKEENRKAIEENVQNWMIRMLKSVRTIIEQKTENN